MVRPGRDLVLFVLDPLLGHGHRTLAVEVGGGSNPLILVFKDQAAGSRWELSQVYEKAS